MAEEAKEMFEKYITEGRARMKEKGLFFLCGSICSVFSFFPFFFQGMLFSPKHEPTFVEHYGELESYVARVGLRRTEAQQFALDRNLKHEMARMNGTDQEVVVVVLSLVRVCS